MISKEQYESMKAEHEEGCRLNDYSKMVMIGSEKDSLMREYLRESGECKHGYIEEIQGGQIERCRICNKTWGG